MVINRTYKKGQSTVEYILVVTAVIAAIIAMTGGFKTKLNSTMNTTQESINQMSTKLAGSRDAQFVHQPTQDTIIPQGINDGGAAVNGGWCPGTGSNVPQVCACPPPKNGGTCDT